MNTRKPYSLIVFKSTHLAIKSEILKKDLNTRIVPTLREISASCGMSLRTDTDNLINIILVLEKAKIHDFKIYNISFSKGKLHINKKYKEDFMEGKYDVVIKGKGMGEGDKVLSNILMNGFLHVLTQKEDLPKNIIFYGEGVYLSCKGSKCLEDLALLAEKGVNILSCGTCLDYYEITDELKVGKVTTMSEVVDLFAKSNNIVIP